MSKGKEESEYTEADLAWWQRRREWFAENMEPEIYGTGLVACPINSPVLRFSVPYDPRVFSFQIPHGMVTLPSRATQSPPISTQSQPSAFPTVAPPAPCQDPQSLD